MDRSDSWHQQSCSYNSFESTQNDTTVEFMDENARMSFYDNEEMEVCSDHFESQMHDENSDSGLGSMSRGKISTLTTMFGLMNSPSTNKCEFDAILESSTENLALDLSDHEKETIFSLVSLEKKSPGRRVLQDITNRRLNSTIDEATPRKTPPGKRIRKLFDRKRSYGLFKNVPSTSNSTAQTQNRKRRGEFLFEKRISSEGIPAAACPIRRIQSTSILESSFNSDGFPEYIEHYSLRTVDKPQIEDTAFRSIDRQTLAELLNSMTEEQFLDKFMLIDCRYPFEYNGGHHAINVYLPEFINSIFYPSNHNDFQAVKSKIPIFYCEFSQKRGPKMARELRRCDRQVNESRYPHLDYREIYVLDHGYRRFFENVDLHHLCEPQHYIPMQQPAFASELRKHTQHRKRR